MDPQLTTTKTTLSPPPPPRQTPDPKAFWNVNIPPSHQTTTCPAYLDPQKINPKDLEILSTPDSEYHILTWHEVQTYIAQNRLDLFQRIPSDLHRYIAYNHGIKLKYGSVMSFVLEHRLGWQTPVVPTGKRGDFFAESSDWIVKCNDWPYGVDERISHLVVWTKFELDEDDESAFGDLTDECRGVVEEFVQERFGSVVGRDNVIWFKNWRALKSVHAVEHFHVMLYDADAAFIANVTNGDEPTMTKVKAAES